MGGAYAIKTNGYGDTVWTKIFQYGNGNLVSETASGYSIIANPFMIYTNSNGDTLSTRQFFGPLNQLLGFESFSFYSGDTNFLAIGTTQSGPSNKDFFFVSNGTVYPSYGTTNLEYGSSVQWAFGGGVIMVGSTRDFIWDSSDIYLLRIYSQFMTLWTKTYGGSKFETGKYVIRTNDGGFMILGEICDSISNPNDILLIKTDSNGDSLWSKEYGDIGDEKGNFIAQTSDGGYVVIGSTTSFGAADTDIFVIKTDSLGNVLWSKIYGDYGQDIGEYIQETNDGGYAILGTTDTSGLGYSSIYFIKTDANGNSGCNETNVTFSVLSPPIIKSNPTTQTGTPGGFGSPYLYHIIIGSGGTDLQLCFNVGVSEKYQYPSLSLYPNPSDGNFYLNLTENDFKSSLLNIYNSLGMKIYSMELENSSVPFLLPVNLNATSGIYLVQVIADRKQFIQKLTIK
jgi:hypothetical protein